MIIPVGHEESEVRRLPWVTFAIMAACLFALLATDPDGSALEELGGGGETPLQDAADYWREHPYLDAPPEVLTEVGYDVSPNQRDQYLALLKDQSLEHAPRDPVVLAAEQRQLDELAGGARAQAPIPEDNPYRKWGLIPAAPSLRTFLSHMFMHGGWVHLLSNLFLFFIAAPALEDRWGRPLFGLFYLLAGLSSGAFFALMATDPSLPLVGASGAIAGVLGAFLVRFFHTKIRFAYYFFFLIPFRVLRGVFESPAWVMLPLWFGNELLSAWLADSLGVSSGVAYWAHVGGFLSGVAVAWAMRLARVEERFIHPAIEAKVTLHKGSPVIEEALRRREAGDLEGAYQLLEEETRKSPGDPDVAVAFWDSAVSLQRPEVAVPMLGKVIKRFAAGEAVNAAAQYWAEMTHLAPGARSEVLTLLQIVPALRAQGMHEEADRALQQAVDPATLGLSPALALRVLEAARERDPATAARAAQRALESPHMPEEKRARLRAQIEELERRAAAESATAEARDAGLGRFEAERALPIDEIEADPLPPAIPEPPGRPLEIEPTALGPPPAAAPVRALGADGALEAGEAAELSSEAATLLAMTQPPAAGAAEREDIDLDALLSMPRWSDVKAIEAVPARLEPQVLAVTLSGGRPGKIAYAQVQAIAVGAVRGLSAKPVVLVDLLLNWTELDEGPLRLVRLRSDRFDPRRLVPGEPNPAAAFRAFLAELARRSGAILLPDAEAARGQPFKSFADLSSWQREVLEVGG